jgi:hypothetical protein
MADVHAASSVNFKHNEDFHLECEFWQEFKLLSGGPHIGTAQELNYIVI